MLRIISILLILIPISFESYSQDIILKDNGTKIVCKITQEDNSTISFITQKQGRLVDSLVSKDYVKSIIYGGSLDSNTDSIIVEKAINGYRYYHKGQSLSRNDLFNILKNNPKTVAFSQNIEVTETMHTLCVIAGAAFAAFPIYTLAKENSANLKLFVYSAICVAISIPISVSINRQTKEVVDIYNETMQKKPAEKSMLKIGFIGNGLGLSYKF